MRRRGPGRVKRFHLHVQVRQTKAQTASLFLLDGQSLYQGEAGMTLNVRRRSAPRAETKAAGPGMQSPPGESAVFF